MPTSVKCGKSDRRLKPQILTSGRFEMMGWPRRCTRRIPRSRRDARWAGPAVRPAAAATWIKQHLKVKRFVGRTKNAVLSQLWVATCMYLLLAYLKFVLRLSWSLHQMLRVLQLNLFDRRPLVELFTTPSPPGSPDPQMLLWR